MEIRTSNCANVIAMASSHNKGNAIFRDFVLLFTHVHVKNKIKTKQMQLLPTNMKFCEKFNYILVSFSPQFGIGEAVVWW